MGNDGCRVIAADSPQQEPASRCEDEAELRRGRDGEAVLVHDLDGRLLEVDQAACEMLGYDSAELVGLDLRDIELCSSATAFRERMGAIRTTGAFEGRTALVARGGMLIAARLRCRLTERDGAEAVLCLARDVHEHYVTELMLSESRDPYALALDAVSDGVWDYDYRTKRLRRNTHWYRLTGYEIGELEAWEAEHGSIIHPDDLRRVGEAWVDHENRRTEVFRVEFRIRHKSGDWRWIQGRGRIIERGPEGEPWRIVGTDIDISGRKRAEEAVRQSESRLRSLYESVTAGVIVQAADGRIIHINKVACDIFGMTAEGAKGRTSTDPVWQMIDEDGSPVAGEEHPSMITFRTGRPIRNAVRGLFAGDPDRMRWLLINTEPLLDPATGAVDEVIITFQDITQLKRAEESLRASEDRYRSIVETTYDWVWEVDREGRHTYSSQGVRAILGYSAEELVGRTAFEFMHEDERPTAAPKIAQLVAEKRGWTNWVIRWRHKDGGCRFVESNAEPILDADGEVVGFRGTDRDITERMEAEETLRTSEERYRSLIENMPIACFTFDREGRFMSWNREAEWIYGYTKEEAIGASAYDLIVTPATREATARVIRDVFAGHTIVGSEWQDRNKAGEVGWRMGNTFPLLSASGAVACGVNMNIDISERKRAERALRDSEKKYRLLVDNLQEGIWLIDRDARTTFVNPRMAEMLGYTPQEMAGRDLFDFIDEQGAQNCRQNLERRKAGITESHDFEFVRKDGRRVHTMVATCPILDDEGRYAGALAAVADITERQHMEEALRREKEFSERLINSSLDGILAFDRECRYTVWNPGMERLSGVSAEKTLGRCAFDVFPFLKETGEDAFFFDALAGNSGVAKDRPFRVPETGREGFFERYYSPLRDESGGIVGGLAIIRDITERKRAEETLRLTQFSVEHTDLAVFWLGPDARFIYVNEAACKSLGYTRDELCSMSVPDVNPEFPEEVWPAHWEDVRTRRSFTIESTHRTKDGRFFPVEVTVNYLEYEGCEYNFAFARDITARKRAQDERRRLEAQMQHAQKLESLGVLAGGIAHDFNNLLAAVLGNTDLALAMVPEPSPARECLDEIKRVGQRAADLTRQMLAYSGKGQFVVEPVDLNRQVEEMAHLLHASVSKKATVRFDLDRELPPIEADPSQVQQVVMNLIMNASDAIADEPGVIALRTGVRQADRELLARGYTDEELPQGRYVFLEVADTGSGMEEATRAKIFDPFFTTKFTGRGLGLAAVLGIVRGHRGAILVESTPDKGSTFTVLFPRLEGAEPQAETPEAERGSQCGAGTVLVIDDERVVSQVAGRILERAGFSVRAADDAAEGIEAFRSGGDEIDAVLLDMTMPDMGGEEVFRRLRRVRPDVPVVLTSGYTEQDALARFEGCRPAGFVHKPFDAETLVAKLREALAAQNLPQSRPTR